MSPVFWQHTSSTKGFSLYLFYVTIPSATSIVYTSFTFFSLWGIFCDEKKVDVVIWNLQNYGTVTVTVKARSSLFTSLSSPYLKIPIFGMAFRFFERLRWLGAHTSQKFVNDHPVYCLRRRYKFLKYYVWPFHSNILQKTKIALYFI